MSAYQSQTDESEDRFHVQFDSAEVRLMSLEELDDAFQRGLIHENTYVLREGDSEWQTLAKVAGLDDEEPEAQSVPAPSATSTTSNSAVYHAPAWPPAATRSSPVAAASVVAPSIPTASAAPRSFIPVVQDVRTGGLDLDDDFDSPFKPKRRWGLYAAVAGVAMAGGAFAVTQLKAPSAAAIHAAAAAPAALTTTRPSLPTPSEAPKTEPAVAKTESTPAPTETKPSADSDSKTAESAEKKDSADKSDRFSDDMKAALLSADKTRAGAKTKTKPSRAVASRGAPRGKAKGKGSVAAGFKNGGSAHDPLNGKL